MIFKSGRFLTNLMPDLHFILQEKQGIHRIRIAERSALWRRGLDQKKLLHVLISHLLYITASKQFIDHVVECNNKFWLAACPNVVVVLDEESPTVSGSCRAYQFSSCWSIFSSKFANSTIVPEASASAPAHDYETISKQRWTTTWQGIQTFGDC